MVRLVDLFEYPYKALESNDAYEFDCGDPDLNEFFLKDAIPHKRELIGVTYFFYDEAAKTAIAFFTVMNDAIRTDGFKDDLPSGKRYTFYPSVKIGRFGVNKKYHRTGIGTQLMDFIKHFFTLENKTGCRFLTLDAYNKDTVLTFYQKCGFTFYTEKDQHKATRTMKYDLKPYSDTLNQILQESGRNQSTYANR
jgi:GNAT superfamily N-acetyltransferase